ncbi:DUF1684 domain-containing protein [Aegicerativicinus sediminis]
MRKFKPLKISILGLISLLAISCNTPNKSIISIDYQNEMDTYWKKRRDSRENNYLKLCGLLKLEDSISFFGYNDYLSPEINEPMSDTIGKFLTTADSILFFPLNQHNTRTEDGKTIEKLNYPLDSNGNSEKLYFKDLYWQIITRSNKKYVRVWHSKNPTVEHFKGYEKFPLNSDLRLKAYFKYYEEAKHEEVKSQLGLPSSQSFVGKLTFMFNENNYSLDVVTDGFLMVSDDTSGEKTYGGGRYLDLDLPEKNDSIILDFNKLYNPPCIFSDFTTCIYPPTQNYLPFQVLAGETSMAKQ